MRLLVFFLVFLLLLLDKASLFSLFLLCSLEPCERFSLAVVHCFSAECFCMLHSFSCLALGLKHWAFMVVFPGTLLSKWKRGEKKKKVVVLDFKWLCCLGEKLAKEDTHGKVDFWKEGWCKGVGSFSDMCYHQTKRQKDWKWRLQEDPVNCANQAN